MVAGRSSAAHCEAKSKPSREVLGNASPSLHGVRDVLHPKPAALARHCESDLLQDGVLVGVGVPDDLLAEGAVVEPVSFGVLCCERGSISGP